ncbi:a1-alpha2 repression, partial [Blyttiomyces sp. JEL0837]
MNSDDVERLKYNILQFEPSLGAYPLMPTEQQPVNTYQKWLRLTSAISPGLVNRVIPIPNATVSSITTVSKFSDVDLDTRFEPSKGKSTGEGDNVMSGIEEMCGSSSSKTTAGMANSTTAHTSAGTKYGGVKLMFTDVDLKRSFPIGAGAAEITKYSMDKSYLLLKTLREKYSGGWCSYNFTSSFPSEFTNFMHHKDHKALLGEIQLSFILFLVGQVFDGLEQWKCLIQLICSSAEAVKQLAGTLYADFL